MRAGTHKTIDLRSEQGDQYKYFHNGAAGGVDRGFTAIYPAISTNNVLS